MKKNTFIQLRKKIIEKHFNRMNDSQLEAVFSAEGPLLVLAGAGSGKTTVIVNRIANLVKFGNAYSSEEIQSVPTENDLLEMQQYLAGELSDISEIGCAMDINAVKPWNILAITFTNKAANELKERLQTMLGDDAKDIWASTFHSSCARILRSHASLLGYSSNYTIYDTDDSKRTMKECQRILG
ncbi:MAG: UvrD-helicase domain-containing protein, partial [Clostridiales bacterium]|nr:UvrD-helicase domain-containing protein [Clostridiales bacterium]